MRYLLVRHKVADFASWKKVFGSHADAQRRAGLNVIKILRNVDDASEVVLLFEVSDLEAARAFVGSAEVPDAQASSGVVDRPDIVFLE
jgi:hypothetical protein